MRLFKKMLIGAVSLAGSFAGAAEIDEAIRYDRTIVITKQGYVYTPPSILDAKHTKMKSLGIFSDAEVNQLDEETLDEFLFEYGINLRIPPATRDPNTGIRSLPGVVTTSQVGNCRQSTLGSRSRYKESQKRL